VRAEGDAFPADAPITITFDFTVSGPLPPSRLALHLVAEDGEIILSSASSDLTSALNHPLPLGRHSYRCTVPAPLLRPGRYFLTISEPRDDDHVVHEAILNFTITEQGSLATRDGRPSRIVPVLAWDKENMA
jgi:hypothetical protein